MKPLRSIGPAATGAITDYHAKLFANELLRRCPSDSVERLTAALMDSRVDLNPHQVDAALFAFRSPLSKGAILADEVGLGKTIEAGIALSQKWAERKRKLLNNFALQSQEAVAPGTPGEVLSALADHGGPFF